MQHDGPVGPQRRDLQAATVAAAVKACMAGGRFEPLKFMPYLQQQQTPEQMLAIIRSVKNDVRCRSAKRPVRRQDGQA